MKSFKRVLCTLLCAVLTQGALTGLAGCKDGADSSSTQTPTQTQTTKEELTLEHYSITLYEGETYTLAPKKTNAAGEAQAVENATYSTDRAYVATCQGGVVTAVAAGQTYVYVKADGMSVSLFVTVKSLANQDSVFIRFMEEQLYAGVAVQARLYAVQNGATTEIEGVTWSTDSEALTVSATGLVTPQQATESAVIKAQYTANGTQHEVEKTVSVTEPLYYTTSYTEAFIATKKTYAGADNEKYTQTTMTVSARNLRTGTTSQLTGAEFTVTTGEQPTCEIAVETDGTVKISGKEKGGKTSAYVQINGTTQRLKVDVDVAYAISTVADMDALSLASHNAPSDLSLSYVLTNDIDYAGKTLYPIALWRESGNRTVSAQWQYVLDYADGKYTYVDRTKLGTEGVGLTDSEWTNLCTAKGINPANTAFKGIFDGNGYAVKNAKLMFAPFVTSPSTSVYSGGGTGVFGYVVGGTVRNVEFDVTLQTPTELVQTFGSDLSYTLVNGVVDDFEWDKTKDGGYAHFSSTIVYRATDASVYNAYSKITLPSEMSSTRNSAGFIGWGVDTTVYNNVAWIVGNTHDTKYYGIQAEGSAKIFDNNLAIGVEQQFVGYKANNYGQNGNWWTEKTQWSDLLAKTQGVDASNPTPLANVIATYDNTVWNISESGLSTNVAPTLHNGCSVR